MKKLILIANDSEETGKTLLTTLCGGLLERKGIQEHILVHTGSRERTDAHFTHLDFSFGFDAGELVSLVEDNAVTVVDLKSGYAEDFAAFLAEGDLLDILGELDTELTVILPVGREDSTFESLIHIAEQLNSSAGYVVIHNQGLGHGPSAWHGSEAERALGFLDTSELPLIDLGENANESDPSELLAAWEAVVDLTELAQCFEGEREASPYVWDAKSGTVTVARAA